MTLDDLSWFPEMRDYNILENHLLGEVMRIYNAGFSQLGVRLTKSNFYGPGQAAQQWLNGQAKMGAFIAREQIAEVVPSEIVEYWRRAYYGGRFEIFCHGTVTGTVYEYDIQSAYPTPSAAYPVCVAANGRTSLIR